MSCFAQRVTDFDQHCKPHFIVFDRSGFRKTQLNRHLGLFRFNGLVLLHQVFAVCRLARRSEAAFPIKKSSHRGNSTDESRVDNQDGQHINPTFAKETVTPL